MLNKQKFMLKARGKNDLTHSVIGSLYLQLISTLTHSVSETLYLYLLATLEHSLSDTLISTYFAF